MKDLRASIKACNFRTKKILKKDVLKTFYQQLFANENNTQQEYVRLQHCYEHGKFKLVPKKMNQQYLSNMFKCETFSKKYFKYLNEDFVTSFENRLKGKIRTYVINICKSLKGPKKMSVDNLSSKIEEDAKKKLPWTLNEAIIARNEFIKEFFEEQN